MFLISHRGNIDGKKNKMENHPDYINAALKKDYDVEIDVRFKENKFYLGHDKNQYEVDEKFLLNKKIWCHAKTSEAILALHKINAHYFWHQNDDYTITSKGFLWTYPGKKLLPNSICVLPEIVKYKELNCLGICSDYIKNYRHD